MGECIISFSLNDPVVGVGGSPRPLATPLATALVSCKSISTRVLFMCNIFCCKIIHATTISSTGVSLTFGIGLASLIISVSAVVILVAVLLVLVCVMRRRVKAADEPVNIELSTVVARKQDI